MNEERLNAAAADLLEVALDWLKYDRVMEGILDRNPQYTFEQCVALQESLQKKARAAVLKAGAELP